MPCSFPLSLGLVDAQTITIPGNVPWAAASWALARGLDLALCLEADAEQPSAGLPEQQLAPAQDISALRNHVVTDSPLWKPRFGQA